jgi:magnesium-transporting ATPase (P-type)
VPFDSDTRRMAVVVDGWVHVKGAPEVLLDDERDPRYAAAAHDLR